MLKRIGPISPLAIMVAILLIVTFLRLVAWRSAPPGMRYDEMTVVVEADRIRAGDRPIYMDGSAEEPLYHYFFAAAEDFIAPHFFTQHWLSAAFGLITVAAIYTLGSQMFSSRIGLLAAALSAAAFWTLMYSRIGFRTVALPAFVSVALIFLWRGFKQSRRRDFVVGGVLLGLSGYTYSAARMLPLLGLGFLAYLFLFNRALFKRHALNITLALLIGVLVALPMVIHIATVPAAERRLGEVYGPLDALQRGDFSPLIHSVLITAGMFIATGDPEWLYNIPNRPIFDIVTGALFFVAVVVCLRRLRQPAYAFILIWLIAGLLPPILTWPAASYSHGILAQLPVMLIAAIGIDAVAARIGSFGKSGVSPGTPSTQSFGRFVEIAFIATVLIIHGATSGNDYFNRWARHPSVLIEHQAGIAAVAPQIDRLSRRTWIVFSSRSVTHWNPWAVTAFRMSASIGYTHTRWFDARSSFVFPQGQTDLTLINAAHDNTPAPLDSHLIEDLFPIVEPSPLATEMFSATHLVSSLNARLTTLTQAAVSWPVGTAINRPAALPIAFNNCMELIGYGVRKSTVRPGKNIRLTTYWRAQNRGTEPLSFFVHVLDQYGNVAAQWDGYTYAPLYVQSGDIIVQVHFIPIPHNFVEGTYRLELGLYDSDTGQRVPIVIDGRPVTDRILLQSIEVKADRNSPHHLANGAVASSFIAKKP